MRSCPPCRRPTSRGPTSLQLGRGRDACRPRTKAGLPQGITKTSPRGNLELTPTAVDALQVDGKTVGVPFEVGEVVFYYNKKLFDRPGVKAEDSTWDDFSAR